MLVEHWNPVARHRRFVTRFDTESDLAAVKTLFSKIGRFPEEVVIKALADEVSVEEGQPDIWKVAGRCAALLGGVSTKDVTVSCWKGWRSDMSSVTRWLYHPSDRSEFACHVCDGDRIRWTQPEFYDEAIRLIRERRHPIYRNSWGGAIDMREFMPKYALAKARVERHLKALTPALKAWGIRFAVTIGMHALSSDVRTQFVREECQRLGIEPKLVFQPGKIRASDVLPNVKVPGIQGDL